MILDPRSLRAMAHELSLLSKEAGPADRRMRKAMMEEGMDVAPSVGSRVAQGIKNTAKRVRGLPSRLGGEATEGALGKMMAPSGAPTPTMRNFGRELGEDAADGAIDAAKRRFKGSLTSKRLMAAGGASLAIGGGLALASRVKRKQRKRDMQEAVSGAIRQQQQQSPEPQG